MGGGEEGKKQEKRARKKGPREGRGGVAAEKAGAAGPGVRRRGAHTEATTSSANAEERFGARSLAGSDGGGAAPAPGPHPPPCRPHPPHRDRNYLIFF